MKHVRNEQVLVVDCRYPYEYDGGHITVSSFLCNLNYQALLFYHFHLLMILRLLAVFLCFGLILPLGQIDNISLN